MKNGLPHKKGFTLLELLVAIAVIGILAALIFPALSGAKRKARRATCLNNLRQINLGLRLYADDSSDKTPNAGIFTIARYKRFMKSYVGLQGDSSPHDARMKSPTKKVRGTRAEVRNQVREAPGCSFVARYEMDGGFGGMFYPG